jgi:hypothetical protein
VAGAGDDGVLHELSRGTTIGYGTLHRVQRAGVFRSRVTIENAVAPPEPIVVKLY